MKSFKDYLTESKKTYDFKIKIAGECESGTGDKIKEALSMYDCASCSAGNRTPIQETHFDFPDKKNIEVTVFDVSLNYPTISPEIRAAVASKLKVSESCVIVRNPQEEAETVLNHANDKTEDGALLDKPLEETDGQSLVGDKHVTSFLKELSKTKTTGNQVKGTNDKILAKKAPAEKSASGKADKKAGSTSPVGSKKITKPDVKSARG
jgi:hypothetical protein